MAYIRHEDKIIKIVDNYPISDIEEKIDIQMEIRKVYKKAHILDMTTTTFQGMSADEVYRKAKAFDKLVEFYPQKDEIPSDEFFMMMGYIIKERADDER